MCYRELCSQKIFLSRGDLKVRPYLVEQIIVYLQLELAQQAERYFEINALDIGFLCNTINLYVWAADWGVGVR